MAMNGFLAAFEKIDTDRDGVINEDDLQTYAKVTHLAPEFVTKWKVLFDSENTGQITYDHFCKVLGISKRRSMENEAPVTPTKVIPAKSGRPIIYKSDMTYSTEKKVLSSIERHWDSVTAESSLSAMQMELDGDPGPRWRTRIINDPYNLPQLNAMPGHTLCCSPDQGNTKVVIWRQADTKSRAAGGCCFC